jgi:peptidoglycan/LPS O-acetylase OafA/YrhL
VGRWSYGIYLWQIPVLLLVQRYWRDPHVLSNADRVLLMGTVVIVAALSFALLESPIRTSPLLNEHPALTLRLAVATIVVGLLAVTLIAR